MIPVKNVLFASEMITAVRGIDPTTGHYYDDTQALHRGQHHSERRRQAPDLRSQYAPRVAPTRHPPESKGALTCTN